MSEKENETSENVRTGANAVPAPGVINQAQGNSSDFIKTSRASLDKKAHVQNLELPDDIMAHQRSSSNSAENLPLSEEPDMASRLNTLSDSRIDYSRLDVTDPNFDVQKWAEETLSKADKSKRKHRRASFAFIGLDVSGSTSGGSDTQATVASVLTSPLSLRKHFSPGKNSERKILSRFDGVVKHGEMLLVLGRPGSGCSTFLKTIAGDLAGLKVSPSSHVGYNGTCWTKIQETLLI
jgi:ATP-binding cassette, subfamily G (WHITE), member 2, PDR